MQHNTSDEDDILIYVSEGMIKIALWIMREFKNGKWMCTTRVISPSLVHRPNYLWIKSREYMNNFAYHQTINQPNDHQIYLIIKLTDSAPNTAHIEQYFVSMAVQRWRLAETLAHVHSAAMYPIVDFVQLMHKQCHLVHFDVPYFQLNAVTVRTL